MVGFKLKVGPKGQVVIPKIVRESLGIRVSSTVMLEVKEKAVEIKPIQAGDLVGKWAERAAKLGGDLKKLGWVYGDKLYEEEFR